MRQRNYSSIHLGTLATMAHFGMNVIGKIQHRRTEGQIDNLATRSQYINPILGSRRLKTFQQAFIIQLVITGIQ